MEVGLFLKNQDSFLSTLHDCSDEKTTTSYDNQREKQFMNRGEV
jgi:hypothetical protein